MRFTQKPAFLFATLVLPAAGWAQTPALNEDQPMMVSGIETVCTGTTTDVRADPKWRDYLLRLEFPRKDGPYLRDATAHISGNGSSSSVPCGGPLVVLKTPRGAPKV